MSGEFIVKYAGSPIRLPSLELVKAEEATIYRNRPDAWYAAYQAQIPAHRIDVVPLAEELAEAPALPKKEAK